ncbi:MAG: type II toxin-antitoxin system RelE/ParE family toxin [Chthoniobacterales bacterium]|nr:type II toxin-antitoxin system RelE/ParE family toxin [Chthoniobacterales bacterium]
MVFLIIDSPEARRDLRAIQRYISIDSPQVALRFGHRLFSKIQILKTHPEIGRMFPEAGDGTIRELIVGNYRVTYEINFLKKQVEVLRYWHAARGAPKIREYE